MFPTGLELALENGDTSLDIFNVKIQDFLLIFAFFSSSHDYYDSKGTENVQKNFCTAEQKLLKTCADKITMRLLNNIQKEDFSAVNLHKNQRGINFAEHLLLQNINPKLIHKKKLPNCFF